MLTRVPHSDGVACEVKKKCVVTRQSYRKAVTSVYAPMRTCTQLTRSFLFERSLPPL
ncbi:hypothetical protein DPMN_057698 [Dreissena polymorpha]|uniref:Uncharacterized protein n=1 Tax=Dreissena polymorpha TaxID=45954 RepID=A0A9D4HCF9_DREPO|nr:hypothetical protein DPMN_057698 [Dreissena polymorpha]